MKYTQQIKMKMNVGWKILQNNQTCKLYYFLSFFILENSCATNKLGDIKTIHKK